MQKDLMMKRLSLTVVAIIAILMAILGFGATPAAITLPVYYNATCQDYTGTWRGFITDPTGLFGNGDVWPIKIYLHQKDGKIIGQSTAVTYAKNDSVLAGTKIWADCAEGVLSKIIWGEKGQCGGIAQQGILLSRNVLIIQLTWESAMSGTTFVAVLMRVDSKYPFSVPVNKSAFEYGSRESCH